MAGSLIVDSSGATMQPASSPVRMQARDGLGAAFASLGQQNQFYQASPLGSMFSADLAYAAYLGSGLLQKVIDIPAADRTREWRDWQADDDAIKLIEAEEKRLQIRAKFKAAEVLRGLGGGALILGLPGEPSQPVGAVGKGTLQAVNLVSSRQLQLVDIDDDLVSPTYGEPRLFRIQSAGKPIDIHPSRVIALRGDPYPAFALTVSAEDRYWGRSRLLRVVSEVAKSDNAAKWFSELIRKAKLLRFGVSGLANYDQNDLNARVSLIATGENMLSATIYNLPAKDGAGGEVGGEKIDDYQVTWAGIPAMMDAFDQRVAAVADIPFTRLMGRSPAGMNATGEHDMNNWHASIGAAQELEVRPCLEQLDAVLLPSAGVALSNDQTWRFSPLGKENPKEEAERFDKTVTALGKLRDMAAMPDEAFNAGVQGVIEANGWMPGALQRLGEMSEEERFGVTPPPGDDDPSALQARSGEEVIDPSAGEPGGVEVAARRRAANDAATGIKEGDWVEFDSDRQTDKGPSSGKVIKVEGDEVTIRHSDDPGEVFSIAALKVKLKTEHYRGGTLWIFDQRPNC